MSNKNIDITSGEALKEEVKKLSLDDWLGQINYNQIADGVYVPTKFALTFIAFIKLVNGSEGESNKSPPIHVAMLDKVVSNKGRIANLCFRGSAKTTIFFEYFTLFLAFYGSLPNFGKITGMIYVSDSMENGVASARANLEFRYNNSEFLQEWIPKARFTEKYIEFTNKEGHKLGIKMFGAATGIRGTKIFGKRPVLAILDDLLSDDDSRSPTTMNAIKDTIHKGIEYALDPKQRKIIFSGTPFSKNDPLVEIVESGSWDVNVYPVCEKFPCSKEEFVGAWEDRFPYEFVKEQYDNAKANGKLAGFYQELMLRITSEEERLVLDSDIQWYQRKVLLDNKNKFNFYITTDFATSDKQTADDSVISVWAINNGGDWFFIDGIAERMTMDKSIDNLFRLVTQYKPQSVGIEITGQQQGFIKWLQAEQMNRNIYFNFASTAKSNEPGIRPTANKLSRFNMVVPWFKAFKMYFPEEIKDEPLVTKFMEQLRLATRSGLKGKDDCLDTISMLTYMKAWRPSEESPDEEMSQSGIYQNNYPTTTEFSDLDSYLP